MKNKLKIYSVLLVVVLVASVCKYLNVYSYSWTNRPGEELILDSLNENFAKIDINTQTWADTIDGTPVTQTSANWHARNKTTFEIGVPVRKRGGLDHYLYSRLTNGQQVMVDMQTVKIKIPIEESQKNIPFVFSVVLAFAFVPFYIWLFVIVQNQYWGRCKTKSYLLWLLLILVNQKSSQRNLTKELFSLSAILVSVTIFIV